MVKYLVGWSNRWFRGFPVLTATVVVVVLSCGLEMKRGIKNSVDDVRWGCELVIGMDLLLYRHCCHFLLDFR